MSKCIIITTINEPDGFIEKLLLHNCDVIIVGDEKTPSDYHKVNCVFLDIKKQKQLWPAFANCLATNHYARKNLGYLFAISRGYKIIYETDDDNTLYEVLSHNFKSDLMITEPKYPNVYRLYTDKHIWPRGYPLSLVNSNNEIKIELKKGVDVHVWQGLVDSDPDVDAIWRMTSKEYIDKSFVFEKDNKNSYILDSGVICPFNTQNTFWVNRKSFQYLYLPFTVTSRCSDIIKSYIAQFAIWNLGGHIGFTKPIAYQDRNDHNLEHDFIGEMMLYTSISTIVKVLEEYRFENDGFDLYRIYTELEKVGIVTADELPAVHKWCTLTNRFI